MNLELFHSLFLPLSGSCSSFDVSLPCIVSWTIVTKYSTTGNLPIIYWKDMDAKLGSILQIIKSEAGLMFLFMLLLDFLQN